MTARSEPDTPSRALLILICALFIFEASLYSTVTPLLARYADDYALGDGAAGLLSASYAIGVAPGAILGAWLAPRLGVRQTSTFALAVIAVGCAGFGAAESIVVLDLTRLASGIGAGCLWAAGLTWLIGATPPARRGAMIGVAIGASTVGILAGPVLGTVAVAVGPASVFSTLAVIAALLVIPVLRQPAPAVTPAIEAVPARRAVRDRELRTGLWLLTFAATIYGVVNVVVPLRLDDLGAGGTLIGAVFLVAAATAAINAPVVGRLVDRRGAMVPAVVALIAAVPVLALVAVPASIAALGVLTVITVGLIASAVATPGAALIAMSGERLGLGLASASAAINVCYAAGETLGGIAGSLVLEASFDAVPFWMLSGAALVMLTVFARDRRRPPVSVPATSNDRRTPVATISEARALVERMRSGWNAGDPAAVAECYSPDAVSYDVEFEEPVRGRRAIEESVRMYLAGFPDSTFTIERIFTDGEHVCEQWVADGHHQGPILGVGPTGNYTKARGCNILRIGSDGLIIEETVYWDSAGMYRQIDALPPLEQPAFTG